MKKVLFLLVVLAALGAGGFYFMFGTLSPCGALRHELGRSAQQDTGRLGRAVVERIADQGIADYSMQECAEQALRLRFLGGSGGTIDALQRATGLKD